jgi:hypothetical protein
MKINETFKNLETSFNIAASIPGVALLSAPLRATMGKIQFLAGLAIGAFGFICSQFSSSKIWDQYTATGFTHVIHGALNFIRGVGEFMLGMTFVGSIGLLAAQSARKERFAPIYDYEQFPEPTPV